MVGSIGSFGAGAYAQTAIQEKLSGQRPQQGDEREANKVSASNREELFRSLLKSDDAQKSPAAESRRVQAEPSGGRGQVLDLNV